MIQYTENYENENFEGKNYEVTVYVPCSPVFSPAIRGIGDPVGVVVIVNVSIVVSGLGVEPSVVPVGPVLGD